jgi:hypothetical protein
VALQSCPCHPPRSPSNPQGHREEAWYSTQEWMMWPQPTRYSRWHCSVEANDLTAGASAGSQPNPIQLQASPHPHLIRRLPVHQLKLVL